MNAKIATVLSLIISIFFIQDQIVISSSLSPPPARTNAPGEGNCANNCHTGNLNTGNGSLLLEFSSTQYEADSLYTLTVRLIDSNASRFGFQLTALDQNNVRAGTFLAGTNSTTSMLNDRQYISHRNANSSSSWTFNWKAPDQNMGNLTFFLSGNGANANNSTSGDYIYTNSFIFPSKNPLSINSGEGSPDLVRIFPNPVINTLYLESGKAITEINIYDNRGRILHHQTFSNTSENLKIISLEHITFSGIALIELISENKSQVRKILIL